jgi:exodeoxyribonuclease V beta subunit
VSPFAALPAGREFGTLVHAVLQHVDPSAPDLTGELARVCASEAAAARNVDPAALAAALATVLETPLGALLPHRRLRDFGARDRLAELEFELPLAGGDDAAGACATLAGLAALWRRHVPDGPLATYADLLEVPELGAARLRGYLTGSIDAVLRHRQGGPHDDPVYVVVDYKTNWLGRPDGADPLSVANYRPHALAAEMLRAHYPLQALLYIVALHRYLRWRQPGYRPERHLGGVLYLFVRGMAGAPPIGSEVEPTGVFAWQPAPALVRAVDRLLATGELEAVGAGADGGAGGEAGAE